MLPDSPLARTPIPWYFTPMRTPLMLCAVLSLLGAALYGCGGADESLSTPVAATAAIGDVPAEAPAAKISLGDSSVTDATTIPPATKAAGDDGLAQAGDGLASMDGTLAKAPAEDPLATPANVKEAPADAEETASGLKSKVLKAGWGSRHPAATDSVVVHYSGWTRNGKRFDSSVARGEPATFPLNAVISGWTEGVQLMVEGEKRRFWIPGDLAYGMTPTRPGAPAGNLVFDIELLEIK
jgi:FKBP-type peptidyl-prolyl cis-trans isomerase